MLATKATVSLDLVPFQNPLLETERHGQKWLPNSVSLMIRSCSQEGDDSTHSSYVSTDVGSFWRQAFKKSGYFCV